MRTLIGLFTTAMILLSWGIAPSVFADRQTILAVMEIQDAEGKLSRKALQRGTEYMRSKLEVSGRFIVVDRSRQHQAMVSQAQQDTYAACVDESCQIELGRQLAADTILRSRITYFAGTCTLSSALVDLARAAAVGGASSEFDCTERGLKSAVDQVIATLLGQEYTPPAVAVTPPAPSKPASEPARRPTPARGTSKPAATATSSGKPARPVLLGAKAILIPYGSADVDTGDSTAYGTYDFSGGIGVFADYSFVNWFALGASFDMFMIDSGASLYYIPTFDATFRFYHRFRIVELGFKAAAGLAIPVPPVESDSSTTAGWNVQFLPQLILRGEQVGFLIEPAYNLTGWDCSTNWVDATCLDQLVMINLGVVGYL